MNNKVNYVLEKTSIGEKTMLQLTNINNDEVKYFTHVHCFGKDYIELINDGKCLKYPLTAICDGDKLSTLLADCVCPVIAVTTDLDASDFNINVPYILSMCRVADRKLVCIKGVDNSETGQTTYTDLDNNEIINDLSGYEKEVSNSLPSYYSYCGKTIEVAADVKGNITYTNITDNEILTKEQFIEMVRTFANNTETVDVNKYAFNYVLQGGVAAQDLATLLADELTTIQTELTAKGQIDVSGENDSLGICDVTITPVPKGNEVIVDENGNTVIVQTTGKLTLTGNIFTGGQSGDILSVPQVRNYNKNPFQPDPCLPCYDVRCAIAVDDISIVTANDTDFFEICIKVAKFRNFEG